MTKKKPAKKPAAPKLSDIKSEEYLRHKAAAERQAVEDVQYIKPHWVAEPDREYTDGFWCGAITALAFAVIIYFTFGVSWR